MSELALKLIKEAKEKRLTRLDLGNCGLTELPDELFELVWLEELILSNSSSQYSFEDKRWISSESQNKGEANNIDSINPKIEKLIKLKKLIVNGDYEAKSNLSDLNPLKGLTQLQLLYFSYTQVCDLAPLKNLIQLQQLFISDTQVCDLSPLKDLTQLQLLHIDYTKVCDLSPLKDLKQLQWFRVNNTQISDLSPLKGLTQLQYLPLHNTRVYDLSPLKDLRGLLNLSISETEVSDLSPLKGLTGLKALYVFGTPISDLSPLRNLTQLKELDICFTKVSNLNPLKELTQLKILRVQKCPIEYIPREIYDQDNCANDLYSYWQDLKQSKVAVNQQLKIMLLGNGCVGKTTLIHWFLDNKFKDLGIEGRTHGIVIQPYLFKDSDVLAHFWDFGGQEVYHATHRLFLGKRSLYILVRATETSEDIKEERHPTQYWLDMIADIGGNERIRVLMVQNLFPEQTERNVLSNAERQTYERQGLNIANYSVDAKRGIKIKTLKTAIEEEAEQLLQTYIEELPKSWVNIRKAVADKRLRKIQTLTWTDFESICQEYSLITSPSTILAYLHNSGELFYYHNQFNNQIILDQEWALKAVYALLKRDRIERFKGLFTLVDLVEFWQKDNPNLTNEEARIFLNFMLANKTLFYTEGGHQERGKNPEFVVPQLLSMEKPKMYSTWQKIKDKTRHRIQYAFLHRDIIERFIVATAHLSKNKDYWRNGLFIDYGDDQAVVEVVEENDIKYIHIECIGSTQTQLLKIIREELNKIRALDKTKEFRFKDDTWEQVTGEIIQRAEDIRGFKEQPPIFVFPQKDIISSIIKTENSMKQHLLNLLAEGKLKEALDTMREISNTQSRYFSDPLIGFFARYNNTKNDYNNGLLKLEEFRIESNRLRVAIESILDSEFDEQKIPASVKIETKASESQQAAAQIPVVEKVAKNDKLKILMLTANPAGTTKLNLDKERGGINDELQARQNDFTLKVFQAVNQLEFMKYPEKEKPDVLHFSGHGETGKYDGGLLVQNDEKNGSVKISPQGLNTLLKYWKKQGVNLKAVVLNACYSAEQAEIISQYVPFVIGTTVGIKDTLAIAFSRGFYYKLVDSDANFEDAFEAGVTMASMSDALESDFVMYKNGKKV
jgi:internalin A